MADLRRQRAEAKDPEHLLLAVTSSASTVARLVTMPAIALRRNEMAQHRAQALILAVLQVPKRKSKYLVTTIVHGKAKSVLRVPIAPTYM